MIKILEKGIYFIIFSVFFISCASHDFTEFHKSKPKSILVLPPLNNSVEVNAPYIYLSLVTKPLAEKGYYVFPVSIIDKIMKQNGAPDPASMHAIPLEKINKVINPDAILYFTINTWGQKYNIFSSSTIVAVDAKMIDAKTGNLLWIGSERTSRSSNDDIDEKANVFVQAVITQVVNSKIDQTPSVAKELNSKLFYEIPKGPYNKKE